MRAWLKRLFHRHRWVACKVQHFEHVVTHGHGTRVLYKCRCGDNNFDTFTGIWTLEDIGCHVQHVVFDRALSNGSTQAVLLTPVPLTGKELGTMVQFTKVQEKSA